jgi:hypothetical protein
MYLRLFVYVFAISVVSEVLINYEVTCILYDAFDGKSEHEMVASGSRVSKAEYRRQRGLSEQVPASLLRGDAEVAANRVTNVSFLRSDDSEQAAARKSYANKTTICFTTSIFGASAKDVDQPHDVREYFPLEWSRPEHYDFILFTNLKDLPVQGWKKVVKTDFPYRRFITQSRWAKFVGWRDDALSHCGTVVFSDGYVVPVRSRLSLFQEVARNVSRSELGLAQVTHHRSGSRLDEITKSVIRHKKDLPANCKVTLKWLRAQPDFDNRMTYYLGKYFGKCFRDCFSESSRV